jgi:hypothetical protein
MLVPKSYMERQSSSVPLDRVHQPVGISSAMSFAHVQEAYHGMNCRALSGSWLAIQEVSSPMGDTSQSIPLFAIQKLLHISQECLFDIIRKDQRVQCPS